MLIECIETIELPFMLNIPSGVYLVGNGKAVAYKLVVAQEQIVAHLATGHFVYGENTIEFRSMVTGQHRVMFWQRLKTLISHQYKVEISADQLTPITELQLHEAVQRLVIMEDCMRFSGKPTEIQNEASARMKQMDVVELEKIRLHESLQFYARKLADYETFLLHVNLLIRLYMSKFNDFFVEQVTLHQLASNTPIQGVYTTYFCDGVAFEPIGVVGKAPPIMYRPWQVYSNDRIDEFKLSLERGEHPSAPELMAVRSRNCLEKGAYRSAIVEASAALDLSLTRKIREGLRSKGSLDTDIDLMLRRRENQGFAERAKGLLQSAVGTTVPAMDNALWAAVSAHRTQIRQGVTHSDAEPEKARSERVVDDFLTLAEMIRNIPIT